ncbi:protein cereblon-like isoform X2 [Xenia sp. Carnegie-2017]|uniref:protein cereblon-like isoform X2 n=1 Tax=Xenia sp. Carnegie-2017 TaxID=2897299 RepID=UPI001F034656|nr:protein cereblon-like isoform X2 [Xenia sp. Carnegie-2017]
MVESYDSESMSDENAESDVEEENNVVDEETKIKFDQSLPSSHTYLGEEMNDVLGRTVMEEDNVVSIPLISLPNLLVPGETLPLHTFNPQIVLMMKNIVDHNNTFGVVTEEHRFPVYSEDDVKRMTGTTCEVYSMREECNGGFTTIFIKAMVRKRFQVLSIKTQLDGVRLGTVRIQPDIVLPAYPNALTQYVGYKRSVTNHHQAINKLNRVSHRKNIPSSSAWPSWVYELYNPYLLMARIKQELTSWKADLNTEKLPDDVTEFSYWVTHNLPLDNGNRHLLLKMNSPVERLRKQLDLIQKYGIMTCNYCRSIIADKKDLFSMSSTGLMGSYVNPGGIVHETITFHKAKCLRLRGSSSTEHSWFPGYAWTIAECKACGSHMGWKFTAVNKKLIPSKFWGLTRASLCPSFRKDEGVNQSSYRNYSVHIYN